jgi:hypothetical protein
MSGGAVRKHGAVWRFSEGPWQINGKTGFKTGEGRYGLIYITTNVAGFAYKRVTIPHAFESP